MVQHPELIAAYRELLQNMVAVYRDFEGGMTPPQTFPAGKRGYIDRLPTRDAHHAILLKLAAMLNFLSGALVLCEAGIVVPQGAVKRMADEAGEDVVFLVVGLTEGMTDRHEAFLDNFWQEDFADFDDPLNSFQSRQQVPREKVAAAIHRISDDPSTANRVAKVLTKAYSGFVHAAAPHVMDLYDQATQTFVVESAPSVRRSNHERDMWNYMFRGANALAAAAKAFGSDAHFQTVKSFIEHFERRTQLYRVGQSPP